MLAAGRDAVPSSAMRSRIQTVAFPSEIGEFADDVRRIFLELGRVFGSESLAGECSPTVDVYETDDTLEIAISPVPSALSHQP
jgi:HSP20 family molecular chaperone IbpA